ncbi:hypothetical protein K469DRAFT_608598, partial [Zopfia rhizophila CBS 207.26]
MLHLSSSPQRSRWACLLSQAAQQINGGVQSFTTTELDFLRKYAYTTPNHESYHKLFWNAAKPNSKEGTPPNDYGAGWLVPDDPTECDPIFVAHSALSAIWLLRETLPKDTLSDANWEHL